MGRKRKTDPPLDAAGRTTVLNLKGTQEQRLWVEGISRRTMIPVSQIVRAALDEWGRKNGHGPMPDFDVHRE